MVPTTDAVVPFRLTTELLTDGTMSEQDPSPLEAAGDAARELTWDGEAAPEDETTDASGSTRIGTTASARFNVLSTVCFRHDPLSRIFGWNEMPGSGTG